MAIQEASKRIIGKIMDQLSGQERGTEVRLSYPDAILLCSLLTLLQEQQKLFDDLESKSQSWLH